MADAIDELILKLEDFAGLKALPQTAREIIGSAINDRVEEKFRAKILEVVSEARRYAAGYQQQAEAEAMRLLIEPEPKPRRKAGLSNTQKAEYWDGLAKLFRGHMPHDPACLAEADRRRQAQPAGVSAPAQNGDRPFKMK